MQLSIQLTDWCTHCVLLLHLLPSPPSSSSLSYTAQSISYTNYAPIFYWGEDTAPVALGPAVSPVVPIPGLCFGMDNKMLLISSLLDFSKGFAK